MICLHMIIFIGVWKIRGDPKTTMWPSRTIYHHLWYVRQRSAGLLCCPSHVTVSYIILTQKKVNKKVKRWTDGQWWRLSAFFRAYIYLPTAILSRVWLDLEVGHTGIHTDSTEGQLPTSDPFKVWSWLELTSVHPQHHGLRCETADPMSKLLSLFCSQQTNVCQTRNETESLARDPLFLKSLYVCLNKHVYRRLTHLPFPPI